MSDSSDPAGARPGPANQPGYPGRPDFTSPRPPEYGRSTPYGPPAAQTPPVAPPPGPLYPPPRTDPVHPSLGYPPQPARRPARSAGVLLMAAFLALVIGGSAGYLGARYGQSTQPDPAVPPPQAAPPALPGSQVSSAPAPTELPPPRGKRVDTVRIAEEVLPSTVTIRVRTGEGRGLGSGFVIDDRGRIMTNSHVVAGADGGSILVEFADGTRSEADVLGRSPSYDLAVLEVADTGGAPPIEFGDSDKTRVGESAVAVGSPLGLGGTVTEGIISAVGRPVAVSGPEQNDGAAYLDALQTDAPINPGNSGGPLVNDSGQVIGVNSAILTGSSEQETGGNIGIGFAIPINQAREIGRLLIRDGHVDYPVIEATVVTDVASRGVRITSVATGGGADRAGLTAGDVITGIDGERVTESEELIVAIRNHRPGDTVTLRYLRGGDSATVQVKLGSKRG